MRTTLIAMFLLIITLTSCDSIKKTVRESYRYEMYIDFRNTSYQGQNNTQFIYLDIDSTNGMYYDGKLIINQKDTVLIRGFEKGSHYVTTYKRTNKDEYGRLEIWCKGETGQIRDSLTIKDVNEVNGLIKEQTTLYRRPRIVCH